MQTLNVCRLPDFAFMLMLDWHNAWSGAGRPLLIGSDAFHLERVPESPAWAGMKTHFLPSLACND